MNGWKENIVGYYTDFILRLQSDDSDSLDKFIFSRDTSFFYGKGLKGFYYNTYEDHYFKNEVKWYDWKEEMIALSAKYPDILFELTGVGEEYPDIWRYFFKAGKIQGGEAKISYPEYDPYNPGA